MSKIRRLICRWLKHVYVIRRTRYQHKTIGWYECLACGYQPAAEAWHAHHCNHLPPSLYPYPSGEAPRLAGFTEIVEAG